MDSLKRKRIAETESSSKKAKTESSRSSLLQYWDYDVFLSFRGPDTRDCFVDYLYEDLVKDHISAFRDSEGLLIGEEIEKSLMRTIERSNIFIPIFSKGYAFSKWCLRELAHVVEHKHEKQVILPIFYGINPGDVRHQTGSYEEAFPQHIEKGINDEVIQNWKKALHRVGNLKGLTLETDANG